jgi:hypothetical protein
MASRLVRLHRRLRSMAAGSEGNAVLEFGLAAPILVILAIGAVDYGRTYVEGMRLTGAAHAGAEQALYDAGNWEATDEFEQMALEEYVGHGLTDDERAALPVSAVSTTFCGCNEVQTIDCTLTCPSGSSANRFVQVTLSRDVALMLPYPWVSSQIVDVTGQAVVRVR